jgi:hypothetical protein
MKLIEEVQARPVEQLAGVRLIFRAEEDGRGKNALKALDHAAVVTAVLGKPEEIEHLSGAAEVHGPALLPQRQGGNPDRDKTVLAKR